MAGKNNALKWVLIGCGGLLAIGLVVIAALTIFVGKKVQDVAQEFEKNPEIMTAKTLAFANPDIDFVSADEQNRTVTFRNNKTGEEMIVDMSELQSGNITFESSSGEKMELNSGDGGMTVTTNEGTTRIGEGIEGDLPSWARLFPNSRVEGSMIQRASGKVMGGFSLVMPDGTTGDDVYNFYKGYFEEAGFTFEETQFTSGNNTTRIVNGRDPENTMTVTITEDNGLKVGVQINGTE
jgi:hypothetical protein